MDKITISVFQGEPNSNLPADNESLEIWKELGVPEDKIFFGDSQIGHITSGTVVPYWNMEATDNRITLTNKFSLRSIALALVDSERSGDNVFEVEIRKNCKDYQGNYSNNKEETNLSPLFFKHIL